MSNLKFLSHLFVLLLLQLAILDNIHLHAYTYVNIYVLAIYILPYQWRNTAILLFGFLLGLFIDFANHTMGIHTVATTLLAYIRPQLLMLTFNNEQIDEIRGKQKISEFSWFFKYTLISTFIFNVVLIFCEVFSFQNFFMILQRIIYSTLVSFCFILLYYFLALKKKQD